MKRLGNLYHLIISIDNLKLADSKARKDKKKSYGVRLHDKNREENILKLHEILKNKTYKTSEYTSFTIFEPKERLIFRLPYYPDRIVHHAIMNILEPIWTKIFTYNTFSCIKGRGISGCAKRVEQIIKKFEGCDKLYCLKIDIKKYYPSINHRVIKRLIRRKIKDPDLLWLLDEIIESSQGLPIGNYLSQYLANLYLAYFMHYVNEVLKIDATEYADDIVFFSDSKEKLHYVMSKIRPFLEDSLGLKIKENYQIFPISDTKYSNNGCGLDYVGFVFYRKQKLIRKRTKKNLCKATKTINQKNSTGLKLYKQQLAPWLGWCKYSNSMNLLKKIVKPEYYEEIKLCITT